mmetsp:Transcript_2965/g.6482  ORF Transcript_2965/g.6482 Transcript_2965/m.6482 type:complete len:326 (+) Transcript_2965:1211-2188(+)
MRQSVLYQCRRCCGSKPTCSSTRKRASHHRSRVAQRWRRRRRPALARQPRSRSQLWLLKTAPERGKRRGVRLPWKALSQSLHPMDQPPKPGSSLNRKLSSSSSSSRHDSLTEVPAPPPPPPPPPPPRIKGNEADGGSVLGTLWNRFTGSSGTEEPNSAAAQATTVTATTTSTLTFTSADDPSGNPPTKPPPAGMKTSPQSSQRKPSPKPKVVIPTAVDRPTWAAKVRPERWLQIPAWARKHLTNEWCEPTQQAKCSDEERAYLEKSLRDFCGGPCQRSHRHALEDEAKRVGAKRGDVKKVAVPWVEKRVAILWSLAVLAPEKSEL